MNFTLQVAPSRIASIEGATSYRDSSLFLAYGAQLALGMEIYMIRAENGPFSALLGAIFRPWAGGVIISHYRP